MEEAAAPGTMKSNDANKTRQRIPGQPLSRRSWAYVCGAFSVGTMMFGLGAGFIPLAFGVLGAILSWELTKTPERRHGFYAGALNLAGLFLWFTRLGPNLHRMFHF